MATHHPHPRRHVDGKHSMTKTLCLHTALIFGAATCMAAVESTPATPVDQVPQTIRTQLVQASGGAAITDIKVDLTHGDPRYIAQYRDPASNEMRTVTLGQMGNVIDGSPIPVNGPDTAVGGAVSDKPEKLKPKPVDGPVPLTPPQRPIAPATADTPAVATMDKDQQPAPQRLPVPEVQAPRPSPSTTTDTRAKPIDLPQKDEDRDGTKANEVSPKKPDATAPGSQKSADPKKP